MHRYPFFPSGGCGIKTNPQEYCVNYVITTAGYCGYCYSLEDEGSNLIVRVRFERIETMKEILPFAILFIAGAALAQAPTCDKSYRLGHFMQLGTEDLRVLLGRHRSQAQRDPQRRGRAQGRNPH
jgi:hypothetical protein